MTRVVMALLLGLLLLPAHAMSAEVPAPQGADAAAISAEMKSAIQKAAKIINQPVIHVPRTVSMAGVGSFSPGWFHAGATQPDFNTVDVRKTRELPYEQYIYVTSDLNPTEMFIGRDLEFNAMTKYFYADRSLPKKKLSEPEMIEINRLYRIIGDCEKKLAALRGDKTAAGAAATAAAPSWSMSFIRNMIIVSVLAAGALIFRGRKKRKT